MFYRGTENNYSYDCYFYNEESWNTCNSYSEEEIYNYSLNTIYNENMNLVGELIFDSNGVYVHNDIPPSQNEQYKPRMNHPALQLQKNNTETDFQQLYETRNTQNVQKSLSNSKTKTKIMKLNLTAIFCGIILG